ncbi:MAG: excinuclease ABC subunit UvrC [Candidatus Hydrogenedentota bacterium]|uniref:UvrABC system protein C n=1 Tax=Sumerlaea chitinivorans TaxID=2250252 RepID=A0A2Z4Y9C7_SUMC1|nr:Excinuclease ABC subunit C [Candidatus Sumerlaea chitinivorans]RMH24885.1 MAG: excinuclease ABC subunit UvrC [Candidatus Hydrogenedentota bacterium]
MIVNLSDKDWQEQLPRLPGVYLFRDREGEVLYVGKAVNLRNRVRSYFKETGDSRFSVEFLRKLACSVECVVTANEKEAFLLENEYIKRYRPRYNIRLRDDKTYVSVRIRMSHPYPRLEVVRVRQRERQDLDRRDLYFGPYVSASAVRETLRFLLKMFPLRTCTDQVFANRVRPCLLYDVGKCCAPCVRPVPQEEYQRLVESVARFLRGRYDEVRATLEQRMQEFAERLEFEKAALARDRLLALEETMERQHVVAHRGSDRDAIAIVSQAGRSLVVVVQHRDGVLSNTFEYYVRNYDQSDAEVLYQLLPRHYEMHRPIPPEILLNVEPSDQSLLEEWLRDLRGGAVQLRVPQRGEGARVIASATTNARVRLEARLKGERSEQEVLTELAERLGLPRVPQTIECADISNLMGAFAVGSIVRFEGLEPDKSKYRRYRIRTVMGANDFGMMREMLLRRFRPTSERAPERPDLFIVDGGKGQLAVARQVFEELGITDVMLAALAKSRRVRSGDALSAAWEHADEERAAADEGNDEDWLDEEREWVTPNQKRGRSEERIFLPERKNPVVFPPNSPALFLLQRIRDEAHRFAITYHKRLRSAENRRSILDEIPAIGERRKRALLKHFGSLAAIRAASLEELQEVPGMTTAAARAVYEFFHPPSEQSPQP